MTDGFEMGDQADLRKIGPLVMIGVLSVTFGLSLDHTIGRFLCETGIWFAWFCVQLVSITGIVLIATSDVTHMKVQDDQPKNDKQVLGLVLITIGSALLFLALYAFYYEEFVF